MTTPVTVELVHERCWCGMPFMLPKSLDDAARNDGHTIYCPLGHSIVWKETEATRMRRERDRAVQEQARLQEEIAARDRRIVEEVDRRAKAERETRRVRRRAEAALCPCCNRHFNNVEAHMKKAHPDVVKLPERKLPA